MVDFQKYGGEKIISVKKILLDSSKFESYNCHCLEDMGL